MEKSKNKWLLRKVSGSRAKYTYKPDYADSRNSKRADKNDLPKREPMGKGHSFLDTSLVKRWLHSQVGNDFDEVYSSFLKRIQPKYLDNYRDCIFYYVEKREAVQIDETDQSVICTGRMPFYIHPVNNDLYKFSEKKIKDSHRRYIQNELGMFFYNKERQVWSTNGIIPVLIYPGKLEEVHESRIEEMSLMLQKLDKLKHKATEAIIQFAVKYKVPDTINAHKTLLRIELIDFGPIKRYNLYFDVANNPKREWKIQFCDFDLEDLIIVEN